ncbi:hypothetical protein QA601_04340 [Chitinispirillales bacterium ANBcel5]|uniref:hypothetical protein n=1 Tax=Cellulosispirillum alkaliphilum TaxID=3039283 RepID=UPI002A57403C|nr:hypothetical protein [Chitinispirillales bacterium ANBcel5]
MKITCCYDSSTIWKASLQYLFLKQFQYVLIILSFPSFAVYQGITGNINIFGVISAATPVFWFCWWFIKVNRQVQLWKELPQRMINFQINDEGFSLGTNQASVEGQWDVINEIVFLRSFILLKPGGVFHTIIIPRKDKFIEDALVQYVSSAGGKISARSDSKLITGFFFYITLAAIVFISLIMVLGHDSPVLQTVTDTTVEKSVEPLPEDKLRIQVGQFKAECTIKDNSATLKVLTGSKIENNDTLGIELAVFSFLDSLSQNSLSSVTFNYAYTLNEDNINRVSRFYSRSQIESLLEEIH